MERNWRGLEWRELANNFSLLRSLQLRESGISWYQNIIKNYSEGRWLYYTPAPHTLNIRGHHYYDQCILTSWLANQRLQITVFSTFLNRGRSREEEVLGMGKVLKIIDLVTMSGDSVSCPLVLVRYCEYLLGVILGLASQVLLKIEISY